MRTIILSCMLLGASYGFSQNKVRIKPTGPLKSIAVEQKMAYQVNGIVHVASSNECATWIEVDDHGRSLRVNPVNLPENFKVDGKRVRFDYGVTTNETPRLCGGKAVYVQNVHGAKPY